MLYLSMEKQEFYILKKDNDVYVLPNKYYFIPPVRLPNKKFKETDSIIIYSLANLGTNLPDIKETLEHLFAYGPTLKILSMNLEFDARAFPYLVMVINELTAMEEQKKKLRLMKQKKGIQKAKDLGKNIGRPQIPYPENWKELYDAWVHKTLKVQDILLQTNLKKSTFYHLVHRYESLTVRNATTSIRKPSVEGTAIPRPIQMPPSCT